MMSGNILTDKALPVPGLDYQDAVLISRMARYVQRLDKQVNILTDNEWYGAGNSLVVVSKVSVTIISTPMTVM